MTREEIQKNLQKIISQALELPPSDLLEHREFSALGLDSMRAAEITGQIEDCLGIPLQVKIMYDYPTLADLSRYLLSQLEKDAQTS